MKKFQKGELAVENGVVVKEKSEAELKKEARTREMEERQAANKAAGKTKTVAAFEHVDATPVGEKKDCSSEMMEAYHPQVVEAAWDSWWNARGFF